jgi:hypothetical protein
MRRQLRRDRKMKSAVQKNHDTTTAGMVFCWSPNDAVSRR